MRGWEGKTGWEQAGAEQEPPTPLDPGPAHFEAPPIQGAWQDFPSSPGKGGGGLGLVRAAGGRDIDHSSLHSWRSQVAARTIFSSPGGGRGAAGRDEIEESCHRLLLEIQAPGQAAHLGGVRCRGRVRVWKLRVQAPHSGAPRLGGAPHGSEVGAAASPGAGGEPQGEGAGLL